MESVLNQKVYQMVIQLKDHQAVVVVQKHEPLEINSRKEKTGFDFISPEKREEKESTENQSGKTRDSVNVCLINISRIIRLLLL